MSRPGKKRGETPGELRLNGLIRGAHDFRIVELAMGVEMECDTCRDRLDPLRVNVADDRDDRTWFLRGFYAVTASGKKGVDATRGRTHGELLVEHLLNGPELRIADSKGLLAPR